MLTDSCDYRGAVDADDVVLGFLKPPGAGVGGVPLQQVRFRAYTIEID